MLELAKIEDAARRLKGKIARTPCVESQLLSELAGCRIHLKFENLQYTASFKERGACNKLLLLTEEERARGVIAMSAGNRPVSLRVYAERIVVAAEGQLLCEHPRVIDRRHDSAGHTVYDWRHYLAVLQRKPGALRNGAPFVELPAAFRQLQAALLKQPGGDREMVEVLALVLHHDEQAVLTAVELALEAGVPTKMHVLNVLHRLLDSKAPLPPVTAPQALRLVREPLANVTRYDDLRASERKVRHAS